MNICADSLSVFHLQIGTTKDARKKKSMTPFVVIEGSTHFCFSHLQKNRKVREMIAATHNFIVSFVEQRASLV